MNDRLAQRRPNGRIDLELVQRLYGVMTRLARMTVFYTRFAVPDTVDGRYDLMCLMLSLFLFRVQQAEPETAQALFDYTFKDVERGLREAGIGDLSVPKHMKKMLAAFYGRAAAYYEALEQQDTAGLAITVTRNLYNGDAASPSAAMAEWMRIVWQFMAQTEWREFAADPALVTQLVPPEET